MSRNELYNLLFRSNYQGAARWREAPYRGSGGTWICFWDFDEKDVMVQSQMFKLQEQEVQVWRARKGTYRKKLLLDVRDVKMEENQDVEGRP